MALVDYSSSSSEDEEGSTSATHAAKKQKTSHPESSPPSSGATQDRRDAEGVKTLPPLPSSFHDLYASTVRVSTSDDPALHQGRKRVNPHKVGSWPSHVYVEWHPTRPQRTTLTTLLDRLQASLSSSSSPPSEAAIQITSFLTSDLDAPLPLHISLSRPLALSTAQKDGFLSGLQSAVAHGGIAPFDLAPLGLDWHRTHESARSFLVLRVGTARDAAAGGKDVDRHGKRRREGGSGGDTIVDPDPDPDTHTHTNANPNPHLTPLLRLTNSLAVSYGQPALYSSPSSSSPSPSSPPTSSRAHPDPSTAFHISLAWTAAAPTPALDHLTRAAFAAPDVREQILGMRVPVDGVKAKIGNVVTHVPLPVRGKRDRGRERNGLFGL
ncbi:U6 snRNA phosphodiesterase Usb1 [Xylariaceae sp. FL0016]|nr:U6 snRNA phosphodiesterase Usb1 [Xylariaceae sp. FL0016]